VIAVVTVIAGIAYREVRAAALQSARDHLAGVSRQLADMFAVTAPSVLTQASAVAKDPSIKAYLKSPGPTRLAATKATLQRLASGNAQNAVAELWDSTGRPIAATRAAPALPARIADALVDQASKRGDARLGTSTALVSPIDSVRDSLVYEVIAAVPDTEGRGPLGFVVQRRFIGSTPQATAQISALIGPDSRFLVGNSSGDIWTDFVSSVAGPRPVGNRPLSGVVEYTRPDGQEVFSALAPIAGTPWAVAVESPRALALAPARAMLWRLGTITLLLLIGAAIGAWVLSGTLSRPIARLADAAKAISAGDYSKRLPLEWRDEIGTFTSAFNEMADQISKTLGELRGKVNEVKDAEARYRLLFEASPHPMWVYDLDTGRFLAVNDAAVERYGYSRDAFLVMSMTDIGAQDDSSSPLTDANGRSGQSKAAIWKHRIASGAFIDVEINSRPLTIDGRPARLVLANDLTDRRRAEFAATRARERLERVINASSAILFELRLERNGPVLDWISDNVTRVLGYSPDEVYRDGWWRTNVHPNDLPRVAHTPGSIGMNGSTNEYRFRAKDGQYRWLRDEQHAVHDSRNGRDMVIGVWLDLTAQRSLEAQLQHSQKMEAVGQLAGGVAHDFNNLLTVMLAECQLIESDDALSAAERSASISEIRAAAERAALLTRQLLTFSRRQLIEPVPIDVNEAVAQTDKMLRRLIGEHIELRLRLTDGAPVTVADRGQVEQLLVNLAVNARDAMPDGGVLTIETSMITLDQAFSDAHIEVSPGQYVLLSVSDTGTGMTEDVKARAFEPFFTTKGVGKGTGLGLATCDAIARQFGGSIAAYSEVGIGTTMKIFLPNAETARAATVTHASRTEERGTETILLVEDDPGVRRSTARMLATRGFEVLQASDASEAFTLLDGNPGQKIHLLITDVVLPKVGGRELADEITRRRPGTSVLFMSGYSDDVVLHHRLTERNVRLLQKPFTSDALVEKVRDALSAGTI
jgi:PAS domain S-box-containing protein